MSNRVTREKQQKEFLERLAGLGLPREVYAQVEAFLTAGLISFRDQVSPEETLPFGVWARRILAGKVTDLPSLLGAQAYAEVVAALKMRDRIDSSQLASSVWMWEKRVPSMEYRVRHLVPWEHKDGKVTNRRIVSIRVEELSGSRLDIFLTLHGSDSNVLKHVTYCGSYTVEWLRDE